MDKFKVLLIDNFDSFTFNLVDEFEKRGCETIVFRNNVNYKIIEKGINENKVNLIVISPGGFLPSEVPICKKIILDYFRKIPIFGVCLGYECIIEAFGGKIKKANKTMHGKNSAIFHDKKTIFKNIKNPTLGGRYHSQMGADIPDFFEISSKTKEGIAMSVRHKEYFIEGTLFHPESVLTPDGGIMIENLIERVNMHGIK